ncbi:MAG: DUF1385 domain-containing protein [Roseiflexaceae bacterium]
MSKINYGGQAVIEGVMMRGLKRATVAVRREDGTIATFHEELNYSRRSVLESIPMVRGVLLLWDTLNLGIRALNVSAAASLPADERPSDGESAGGVAVSLLFAFLVFFALPVIIANALTYVGVDNFSVVVIENVFQLVIFIGYLLLVGRIPEIQRVYGYHGAEHKAINAYEAGLPLDVPTVSRQTLIHPRCGTSFLLVVMVISIPIFAIFQDQTLIIKIASRLVLIPVIAGLSFELLRVTAANYHRAWVRWLVAPSLALQRLTTREPDDSMVAVAIAALLPVLAADQVLPAAYDESLGMGIDAPTTGFKVVDEPSASV